MHVYVENTVFVEQVWRFNLASYFFDNCPHFPITFCQQKYNHKKTSVGSLSLPYNNTLDTVLYYIKLGGFSRQR